MSTRRRRRSFRQRFPFATSIVLVSLVGLGWWAQNSDLKSLAKRYGAKSFVQRYHLESLVGMSTPTPAEASPAGPTVQRIGEGALAAPRALAIDDSGKLYVTDGGSSPRIRVFSPEGKTLDTIPLPENFGGDNAPDLLTAVGNGVLALAKARTREVYFVRGKESPQKLELSSLVLGLAGRDGVLYVLGGKDEGIARVDSKTGAITKIALDRFPSNDGLRGLRIGPDGSFYTYIERERLVWRFSSDGKFIEKIGGGGAAPPQTGLPAQYISSLFDVDSDGNVLWTLGDYGALLQLTRAKDGKPDTAVHYFGKAADGSSLTGVISSLTGFVATEDNAYILDAQFNRITVVPRSWAKPGSKDTQTIDARSFGLNFDLQSDAPYKLFTGESAQLKVAFGEGNRSVHKATLALKILDYNDKEVATSATTFDLPGDGAKTFDLSPIPLPRLGWHQVQARVLIGKETLFERVQFIGRTVADAAMPIPQNEQTGWDDLATHQMTGFGLHRFSLQQYKQIDEFKDGIMQARKMGVPYFVLFIRPEDCTPEAVRYVVEKLKEYGDDAPKLEIVNEPNLNMGAADYIKILQAARDEIKRVNPKAQVMGPSQCGIELNWFQDFLRRGGGDLVDIVSVHTYERNNSMDAAHWVKKFSQIRELMKKYRCGDKPLYQTEHGYLGDYHGSLLRPQWQARSLSLEQNLLERYGIGRDEYSYYYVNEGGYRDFSAQVVDGQRELYPAALMTRARTHFLKNAKFVRAFDFGETGNRLLVGNEYSTPQGRVLVLQNTGALEDVQATIAAPPSTLSGAAVRDCWGNAMPFSTSLRIPRTPIYVLLKGAGQVRLSTPPLGRDIAPQAKITCDDAKGQSSVARLTNGDLEFDFHDEPLRVGFLASDGKLPLDVTMEWNASKTIKSAILYASLADNAMCTPLDYEVFARQNNIWKKIDEVNVKPTARTLKLGNIARFSSYDNPWIFVHHFKNQPVTADALRFRFKATTYGQYPTRDLAQQLASSPATAIKPRVELREVQVFSP